MPIKRAPLLYRCHPRDILTRRSHDSRRRIRLFNIDAWQYVFFRTNNVQITTSQSWWTTSNTDDAFGHCRFAGLTAQQTENSRHTNATITQTTAPSGRHSIGFHKKEPHAAVRARMTYLIEVVKILTITTHRWQKWAQTHQKEVSIFSACHFQMKRILHRIVFVVWTEWNQQRYG